MSESNKKESLNIDSIEEFEDIMTNIRLVRDVIVGKDEEAKHKILSILASPPGNGIYRDFTTPTERISVVIPLTLGRQEQVGKVEEIKQNLRASLQQTIDSCDDPKNEEDAKLKPQYQEMLNFLGTRKDDQTKN